MPIYDFQCDECGKSFESLMKPYDPVQCPHCRSTKVKKLISFSGYYKFTNANPSSSTPKKYDHAESRRREGKRERVTRMIDREMKGK